MTHRTMSERSYHGATSRSLIVDIMQILPSISRRWGASLRNNVSKPAGKVGNELRQWDVILLKNVCDHSLCYTCCGALARSRYSSMCPPLGIDLMTHHTINGHCTIELEPVPIFEPCTKQPIGWCLSYCALEFKVEGPAPMAQWLCHRLYGRDESDLSQKGLK